MAFQNPPRDRIKEILGSAVNIAVVGLSENPDKTSHMVAAALQAKGYRIIPVNPNAENVLGEKSYASLKDIPDSIDIIDVFRRPEHTPDVARDASGTGAKVFWLQTGIINEEAAAIAADNGMESSWTAVLKSKTRSCFRTADNSNLCS